MRAGKKGEFSPCQHKLAGKPFLISGASSRSGSVSWPLQVSHEMHGREAGDHELPPDIGKCFPSQLALTNEHSLTW